MSEFPRNSVTIAGGIIALLGVLAILIPILTTHQTKDVANIGELHVTATEEKDYVIPPLLGPAGLAVGVILIGVGFATGRRRSGF